MSIEEKKAAYEKSAIRQLLEAPGHHVCERCYCCDAMSESTPCWQCGGFEPDWQDDDWDDICSVCLGEGELFYMVCCGNCDENGNHVETKCDVCGKPTVNRRELCEDCIGEESQ